MAAAVGAQPLLPPPSTGTGAATERALEEAAASGTLVLTGRRLRAFPAAAALRWDLSDTTQADLSRNRFGEVPEAACRLVALEGLSLHHNCLRSVPAAIANLQALTHLDLSRNQLSSLPPSLCLLPLRVLNASSNRLAQLPDNIGAIGTLRQLDVSSNALRALPPGIGRLRALRDLNLRRNLLTVLPGELSDLPLVHLDFSCNRVSAIPRCYRRLRHLQSILTEHNPLQSPPAQICLKGKVHIFKYLEAEAVPPEVPPPTGPTEELSAPPRQRHGLDSGFHSVDSGSKRWSGNESTDEFAERMPRGRRCAADSDPEEEEERPPQLPTKTFCPPPTAASTHAPPDHDEGELMAEMQQSIESLLQLRLSNEELLSRLTQRLRPPPAPNLNPTSDHRTRQAQPHPPGLLVGFALFYGLAMALLYAGYRALFGC